VRVDPILTSKAFPWIVGLASLVVSQFLPTQFIPLQPKACVSEIYCYSSGLSFAALEAGEIES